MSGDLIYVQLESQKRENKEELFEEIMAKTFLKLMNNNPKIQKPRGSEAG